MYVLWTSKLASYKLHFVSILSRFSSKDRGLKILSLNQSNTNKLSVVKDEKADVILLSHSRFKISRRRLNVQPTKEAEQMRSIKKD